MTDCIAKTQTCNKRNESDPVLPSASRGPLAWRDPETPVEILERSCAEGEIQWAEEDEWVMVDEKKVELGGSWWTGRRLS